MGGVLRMSRPGETPQETINRLQGALNRQGANNEAQRLRIKELEAAQTEDDQGQELARLIREIVVSA